MRYQDLITNAPSNDPKTLQEDDGGGTCAANVAVVVAPLGATPAKKGKKTKKTGPIVLRRTPPV